MQRFAHEYRVYFFEEPISNIASPTLLKESHGPNLTVVTPLLPAGLDLGEQAVAMRALLKQLWGDEGNLQSYAVVLQSYELGVFSRHRGPNSNLRLHGRAFSFCRCAR